MNELKHYWLYVLRLEQEKYYVGLTSKKDPNVRIQEHMNGFYSAQWVKKYKPIEPIEIISIGRISKVEADRLELKRTLQYMEKYGYQNTRGGRLNYSGRYMKLGSLFWREEDFKLFVSVLFMMVAIVALLFMAL